MPTGHFIDVHGLRTQVLTWDGGGDTTVLLLHGFLDHAWSWHDRGRGQRAAPAAG